MAPQHLLVVDIETVPDEAHHEGDGFPKPPFHTVVAIGLRNCRPKLATAQRMYQIGS